MLLRRKHQPDEWPGWLLKAHEQNLIKNLQGEIQLPLDVLGLGK